MYSLDQYRSILSRALKHGYQFASFLDTPPPEGTPTIYLRHDVDWSPLLALQVAQVNHALGVKGTFFVQIRSPFYNLYSGQGHNHIRAILELGQHVGFHYASPAAIPDDPLALVDGVLADFKTFNRELPGALPVFSWHNTTPAILEWGLEHEIPGLVNTYARRFFKDIAYYSDSLARYTPAEFEAILDQRRPALQVLLHPDIWGSGGANLDDISARLWQILLQELNRELLAIREDKDITKLLPRPLSDSLLETIKNWLRATD
jgi:hypothetical protein